MRARSSAHRRGTRQRLRRRTQHEQGSRRSSCTPPAGPRARSSPRCARPARGSSRWKARSTTPSPRQTSSPGARVRSWSTRRTRIGSKDRRPQLSRSSSSSAGRPTCSPSPTAAAATRSAYAKGFLEAGFPTLEIVPVEAAERATTGASAIRIPTPVHRAEVDEALARSGSTIVSVTDDEIATAWRSLAREEGVFCEPASAAALAGVDLTGFAEGTRVVLVLTGHGLKDPEALDRLPGGS